MEQIKLKDINLNSLKKLEQQGTKSTVYRNGTSCIKMLDGFYEEEKDALFKKFLDMEGLEIDNVLLPKELIVSNGKLEGYTMDYFPSVSLNDKLEVRQVDTKVLFDYVYKASKILREIHRNGIICQDLSFENILVDDNGNVKFCDLDGCSYKDNVSPFVSLIMKRYFIDYRKEQILLCTNLDRVGMMLSFFFVVYAKELQKLNRKSYSKLAEKSNTLEEMRKYANALLDRSNPVPAIPYLDELIWLDDDLVYDRDKQLSLFRRIIRRQENVYDQDF